MVGFGEKLEVGDLAKTFCLGGHSGETDTKDNGYLEKLEYLSCKYKTDRKYKHPTLTEEQIDREIRTINSSMKGAKRGKTYNKHTGK